MKLIHFFFTSLLCFFTSFVIAQEKKDKELIKIYGTADTLVTPNYYDFYITMASNNPDDATMSVQNKIIKQLFYDSKIDTSKVIIFSVTNNSNEETGEKKIKKYNIMINGRTFNVSGIKDIIKKLRDNDYKGYNFVGKLSDSEFDKDIVSKLLLTRAIRNGKEKAEEVANELGMKSVEFVSFSEGNLTEGMTEYSSYGGGESMGKIKLTKHVTIVYRLVNNK